MSEMIVPEVFTNPDFEYIGTYKEIREKIKIDMLFWKALCAGGYLIENKNFSGAMRLMSKTLKDNDFHDILESVRG